MCVVVTHRTTSHAMRLAEQQAPACVTWRRRWMLCALLPAACTYASCCLKLQRQSCTLRLQQYLACCQLVSLLLLVLAPSSQLWHQHFMLRVSENAYWYVLHALYLVLEGFFWWVREVERDAITHAITILDTLSEAFGRGCKGCVLSCRCSSRPCQQASIVCGLVDCS